MANIRNYHQLQDMRNLGYITEAEYVRITNRIAKADRKQMEKEVET